MSAQIPPGTDLSTIPAGIPPLGVTPNFVDPPSLAHVVLGVNITFMILATLAVTGRLITNVTKKRVTGLDDSFCFLAFVGAVGYSALVFHTIKFNRHQWDIPLSWFDASYFKKSCFTQRHSLQKVSILLLYSRIFVASNSRNMIYLIYLGILASFCFYIPNIILASWYCAPHIGESWNLETALRCKDTERWYLAQAVLIVLLDLYIFILPLPTLLKLNMSRNRRISVLLVFMTALLAIIAAIATLANRPTLLNTADQTWYGSVAIVCSSVENYVAIIVSSAPALSCFLKVYIVDTAFYNTLRSRFLSTTSGGSKDQSKKSWPASRPEIVKNSSESSSKLNSTNEYVNLDNVSGTEFHSQVQTGAPAAGSRTQNGILRSVDVTQGFEDREHGGGYAV
ncbi:hypothetical protein G7Y89_g4634 [Cudoniella acicularis]|uniref:Rhodopsin domain-containing protein n=1 Tax=Cudoniella acicularis TaxID=354080 RepID=A0A8H4W4I8_9HELO|nr:hypothetical protein G7Y89_g4634 [Cudoniella acicularis]